MSVRARVSIGMVATAFIAAACSGVGVDGSSSLPPTTTPGSSPASASSPSPSPTPFGPDILPLAAGLHAAQVLGSGTYLSYTVVVPPGWYDFGGKFTLKYPTIDGPARVLGVSVWDVGTVFRDPCHWTGQAFDPGPGVANLVAALVSQKMRNATKPTDVTLAGYTGRYLEWSVPADMKSSTWTDFDACDVEPSDGHRNFMSWLPTGKGGRYQQVPGQIDRLWALDVKGQRLLVDATYSSDTTPEDRTALEQVVDSLRFVAP